MFKLIWTIILIVIAPSVSIAYTPYFNKLTSIDGISQSEIYCFAEDEFGFIWFGTVQGLNCYDGYSVKTFNIDNSSNNSLSNNTILTLNGDDPDFLWIGTNNGLNIFDYTTQTFQKVQLESDNSEVIVSSLMVDGEMLWVGTNKGLFIMDLSSGNIDDITDSMNYIDLNFENRFQRVKNIIKSVDGTIWLNCGNSILHFRYDYINSNIEVLDVPDGFMHKAISSIYEDNQGNLWLGGVNFLFRFNSSLLEVEDIMADNIGHDFSVTDIVGDNHGNIWIGTSDEGLYSISVDILHDGKLKVEKFRNNIYNSDSINSDLIYSLYVSDDDILWVGTIGSGVNYLDLNRKMFLNYRLELMNGKSVQSNFIRSVYQDYETGMLWLGVHNNGLFCMDMKTGNSCKKGFGNSSVFHICEKDKDNFFVCTATSCSLFNKKNGKSKGILKHPSFYVTRSKNNIYWIASMAGLFRYDSSSGNCQKVSVFNKNQEYLLSNINCRVLLYLNEANKLFVGSEGGFDLITLDKNHIPVFIQSLSSGMSNSYVRSLYQENDSTVWAGTFNGLNRLLIKDGMVTGISSYYVSDGLPSNVIQSISGDGKNHLWIGTNAGLVRLDTEEMKFDIFSNSDGVQDNEFSEHASYRSPAGELFFGGINGVTTFYPDEITLKGKGVKNIVITDLYVSNSLVKPGDISGEDIILSKPVYMSDAICLKPHKNNIRFDFSSMIFCSAQKIKYRYKMVGYDQDWIYTDSKNRSAVYTNLPYGEYEFCVESTNSDGIWLDNRAKISIEILTPLFLKPVFIVLYCLLFVILVIAYIKYRTAKDMSKQRLILENEHNKRLHQLDEMRTRFFINISHDLRTPLTLIINPLEHLIKNKNMNDSDRATILERIYKSAKRLHYLIEQLLDFRRIEVGKERFHYNRIFLNEWIRSEIDYFEPALKEKGLELRFNMPNIDYEVLVDCRKLSKIIFNLMSNAIKFTAKGYVSIASFVDEKKITIEISDSGIGIEKERIERIFDRYYSDDSYGIGLSHCKDLVNAMGGDIVARSENGKGSTFTVQFPVGDPTNITCPVLENSIIEDNEVGHKVAVAAKKEGIPTILVIDDNYEMRQYISLVLSERYNVLEASGGVEGYNLAKSESVDMIISDVMMPDTDGVELCRMLKNDVDTSDLPLILLTAKTDNETQIAGLSEGADDYVSKPFSESILLAKIESLLMNRDLIRRAFVNGELIVPSKIAVTSTDVEFLEKLMHVMELNMSRVDLNIEDIENEMCMSHSSFFRKLKRLTGMSGKEMLQDFRLKRAMQMIEETDMRLNEIAFAVGFSEYKYFARCFKNRYGKSPSSIRKANNEQKLSTNVTDCAQM